MGLLLQEHDFEVVHRVGITNLDADGLSRNPSPSEKDLTGTRWHGDCDREAVLSWHAVACFTLFSGAAVEVPLQGSDDRMINLKLLPIYGRIFPYCINFSRGPFLRLPRQWKGIALDIE